MELEFAMSMSKDADHTAIRINISRILELFTAGDISPVDAVSDLKKFCHPELVNADNEGLEGYLTKTLNMIEVGEIATDRALKHFVDLAHTRSIDASLLPIFAAH